MLRRSMLASPSPFFGLACCRGRGFREYVMSSKTSLDKSRIKFLLLEGIHPSAVEVLHAAGYTNVESLPGALPDAELKAKIADVHFLGIRSRTQLTAEVFAAAQKLVAAGCFCIGTNQVDLEAAREHGVAVFNAPYSNTRSVAELVLAEAILLLRGVPEKSAVAHRGGWLKSAENAFEIRGKTLGIVGYGSIGAQLSVLAENQPVDREPAATAGVGVGSSSTNGRRPEPRDWGVSPGIGSQTNSSPRSGRQRCRPLRGLMSYLRVDPGACAPGFILPSASRTQRPFLQSPFSEAV